MNIVDTLLLLNLAAMSLSAAQSLSTVRMYMALGLVLLPVFVFMVICVSVTTIKIWKTLYCTLVQGCKRYRSGVQMLPVYADNGIYEDATQQLIPPLRVS